MSVVVDFDDPEAGKDDLVIRQFVYSHAPDRANYLDRFREDGFRINGRRATLPNWPITLYRGCAPNRRYELSWTKSRAVARRWATSEGQLPPFGRLFVIEECPPGGMLAWWAHRHEAEVIVDTAFPGVVVRDWTMQEIASHPEMQRSADYGLVAPKPGINVFDYRRKHR